MRTYRYLLTGLGNIGRTFLEMLHGREQLLRERYGLELRAVGAADSSGVAYDPAGLDVDAIIAAKRTGGRLSSLPRYRPAMDLLSLVRKAEAEVLFEATPTNLQHGQPGLDLVRGALGRGMHAILASKGPLVLAYNELAGMSDLVAGSQAPALRFSGAVGGALPSINIGWRDLAGARLHRVELVVNGTSQVILQRMAEGRSFEEALADAQAMGIVEPDPALDVDGWDAANKLVIFANAVLGQPTTLADLSVGGIRRVERTELEAAWGAGGRISLVGLAEAISGDNPDTPRYRLSVAPAVLGPDHPLARLGLGEMGIVYYSDTAGRTVATSLEDGPLGTTQAMLRDMIDIHMAHIFRAGFSGG